MNKTLWNACVQEGTSLTSEQARQLDEVLARTPWFSSAQLFKAGHLVNTTHPEAAEQVQKAAVYINDRSVLFELVSGVNPTAREEADAQRMERETAVEHEVVQEEKVQASAKWEAAPPEPLPTPEPTVEREVVEPEWPEPQPLPDEQSEVEDVEKPRIQETSQEEIAALQEDLPESKTPANPELEKDILISAVSRIIENEVQEEMPLPADETEVEWSDEGELSPFARMLLRKAKDVGFGESSHIASELSQQEAHAQGSGKSQEQIIDSFIKKSPRITPSKSRDYSEVDWAKESLIEDDSFVTETMAQLYARQGKIEKARKAYKLLSLKYPEKSVYFAGQLKKLTTKK